MYSDTDLSGWKGVDGWNLLEVTVRDGEGRNGMAYRTGLSILLFAFGAVPTFAAEPGFRSLFNGKDLTGWDGEAGLWRVKDGVIEGGHPDAGPIAHSSWLILRDGDRDATLRDFHFRCDFKMGNFNSGVQYRSTRSHPKGFRVGGYQADLLNGLGTGQLHHEAHQGASVGVGESVINEKGGKGIRVGQVANGKWLMSNKYYEKGEWTRIDVVCRGNHLSHFVNGYPVVEVIDRDDSTADRKRRNDEGIIALQLHGGTGTDMRVSFRNLFLKTYSDRFGDAVRLFDDGDLSGWKTSPDDKAWSVKATRDKEGRSVGFGMLMCDGTAKAPLVAASDHGGACLLRCQVKTDAWTPGAKAPFKGVDGWNLLEVTVGKGKSIVVYNGEPREDLPPFVQDGKLALPGHVAAAYRNVVVIPIVLAK